MAHDETVKQQVQQLSWALVDNQINEDEMRQLELLLASDEAARETYVECVQMHSDLLTHFTSAAPQPHPGKSPVLGFLGDGVPPADVQSSPQ